MIPTATYPPQPPRYYHGGYRYFFNGQESDAEAYGQGGLAGYEFRQYDTRLGRWWGVDTLFAYNHSFSPYIFTNNNPILLIDFKGGNPIDPRTGKPFPINFTRAAVFTYPDLSTNVSKNPDADLIKRNTGFWRSMYRVRGRPDGLWDGAYYFEPDRSLSKLSKSAISELKKLFPSKVNITNCYSQESTYPWLCAAEIGTYSFIDRFYCELGGLFIDFQTFNIISVENNYISQIIHFERDKGEDSFNIVSITSFHIDKGEMKTRYVKTITGRIIKQEYRILKVTESIQNYKDNKPYGKPIKREYEKEEIID